MSKALVAVLCAVALSSPARAQQPAFRDALLDHLAGSWVLQGTIAGKQTTHDITAEWVLGHQYLRLQEVSREKKDSGEPAYQAMVFFGWDQTSHQYVCFWLDDFGGGFDSTIGHAKRDGNEIALLFNYPEGPFHTTFAYDPQSDSWQMQMDSEEKGKLKPFARTKLTRK
jgi:Protein of unknown function (DUF1579)